MLTHGQLTRMLAMSPIPQDLTVRQHARYACAFPAQVAIAASCTEKVRLTRAVGSTTTGLAATVIDVSHAGVGLSSTVYLPIGCVLNITINPADDGPPVVVVATIARAIMVDRSPTYQLGTLLESVDEGNVNRLIAASLLASESGFAGGDDAKS